MKEKSGVYLSLVFIITFIIAMIMIASETTKVYNGVKQYTSEDTYKTFTILSSQENKPLEEIIYNFADRKGYNISIEYAGTLDIIQMVNANSESYDAVWTSNSIWNYMIDSNIKTSESKCTSINPVVFAIKKSKAQELGFIGRDVYTIDILNAIAQGKLKFSMSNPTSTNSGASAYLGLLATLAGNPEVLTEDILENEQLKQNLKIFFSALERSSGSEDFLEELILKEDFEAVFTYESSIININKELEEQNKEIFYAVYPIDGVSVSDSPITYIDHNNSKLKEVYEDLQAYILSNEGQELLQQKQKPRRHHESYIKKRRTIFRRSRRYS